MRSRVCGWRQRWASTLTSWSNAWHRSNTRPLIKRSERLYFFETPKAKIIPSTTIVVDRCQSQCLEIDFYTFKTLRPVPRLFQRSKVISINLPILPFLKFKIWCVLMPTSASGCWRVATLVTGVTCVYLSVRNCPGAGEGWGGGMEFPVAYWIYMKNGPRAGSHAQTESQRPHIKKNFTKIKNYGQWYRSWPLQRSLLIVVDHNL